ncbi:NAD-dependent epimerase/dehydratase domain-containing protein [Dioscorea alata]|uniref:NAD-dependent epimerase/dehydratase domain-containing protein n=1 Tax=Dioscorea alata TaxID=55571 RepID=A0ACB7W5A6_DIOAL|nr:NAD-dependent epimerase/dehydratase domain-containing protein [Dioscorea alata]
MSENKSKILIIGGTAHMGKFIVQASANSGHPTFIVLRPATASDPVKANLINNFKNSGVTILYGDIHDHESLVKAIKQVDVVISALGSHQVNDQTKIIDAIKEAGNIKRFFPSEFGTDVDRAHSAFLNTFVVSNLFASYFLPTLAQAEATGPPTDKVFILGDGTPRAIIVKEEDIATYTIRAVDDPRTVNMVLYLKPPANFYSQNELVALWEKKTGKTMEKIYVPEDQIFKRIQETEYPVNLLLAINHSVFVNGDCTNFEIEPRFGVEASKLYPDV